MTTQHDTTEGPYPADPGDEFTIEELTREVRYDLLDNEGWQSVNIAATGDVIVIRLDNGQTLTLTVRLAEGDVCDWCGTDIGENVPLIGPTAEGASNYDGLYCSQPCLDKACRRADWANMVTVVVEGPTSHAQDDEHCCMWCGTAGTSELGDVVSYGDRGLYHAKCWPLAERALNDADERAGTAFIEGRASTYRYRTGETTVETPVDDTTDSCETCGALWSPDHECERPRTFTLSEAEARIAWIAIQFAIDEIEETGSRKLMGHRVTLAALRNTGRCLNVDGRIGA